MELLTVACVQVIKPQMDAKSKGFTDVLYLDAVHNRYLEEVSSCNVFVVKDDVIATPATRGTILPGITRKSVIELAADRGYKVSPSCLIINPRAMLSYLAMSRPSNFAGVN
jgi:branched-chain amino acid aminotransferase